MMFEKSLSWRCQLSAKVQKWLLLLFLLLLVRIWWKVLSFSYFEKSKLAVIFLLKLDCLPFLLLHISEDSRDSGTVLSRWESPDIQETTLFLLIISLKEEL